MAHRFSQRTSWNTGESTWARTLRNARALGMPLLDLTTSNPTHCGFTYNAAEILPPLASPEALTYGADPLGLRSARESVAHYYTAHHVELDPDHLLLTTSTSEGYAWLFKLLCDAGDSILVPTPSYPLFDYLAELEALTIASYPLFYDHGWWIDAAMLERSITPSTRAVVVVHPNNPTGHATGSSERLLLEEICLRHNLALIVDEVFLDYPIPAGTTISSFATGPHPVPTFVLSGMSKVAALPQMKAAWIAVFGPPSERSAALSRLEVIGDTYLSMNAPVQAALPVWLGARSGIQVQIRSRIAANLAMLQQHGIEVLRADGGWNAILRIPRTWGDGTVFERLLTLGVVVHPGDMYGMPEPNRVVVSLIVPADVFAEGARRIVALVHPANAGP